MLCAACERQTSAETAAGQQALSWRQEQTIEGVKLGRGYGPWFATDPRTGRTGALWSEADDDGIPQRLLLTTGVDGHWSTPEIVAEPGPEVKVHPLLADQPEGTQYLQRIERLAHVVQVGPQTLIAYFKYGQLMPSGETVDPQAVVVTIGPQGSRTEETPLSFLEEKGVDVKDTNLRAFADRALMLATVHHLTSTGESVYRIHAVTYSLEDGWQAPVVIHEGVAQPLIQKVTSDVNAQGDAVITWAEGQPEAEVNILRGAVFEASTSTWRPLRTPAPMTVWLPHVRTNSFAAALDASGAVRWVWLDGPQKGPIISWTTRCTVQGQCETPRTVYEASTVAYIDSNYAINIATHAGGDSLTAWSDGVHSYATHLTASGEISEVQVLPYVTDPTVALNDDGRGMLIGLHAEPTWARAVDKPGWSNSVRSLAWDGNQWLQPELRTSATGKRGDVEIQPPEAGPGPHVSALQGSATFIAVWRGLSEIWFNTYGSP